MPLFDCIKGVNIPEIVCALPSQNFTIAEYAPNLLTEKTAKRMAKETGFHTLRISPENTTTSDLFVAAAEKLLENRNREEIAAIVFVTQYPDYIMPATSHTLQDRLELSNNVLCLDINEGCSGFITGLYTASCLSHQFNSPVLLGCGDTSSKGASKNDRATRCLFGDGVAVVFVEPGEQDIPFAFASYGDKRDAVIMQRSMYGKNANSPNGCFLYIDGVEILNFSLNEVPDVINSFMTHNNLTDEDISLYACHQANKLILDNLADKLGVSREKMPFTSGDIGNESSASIPSVITRRGGGGIYVEYSAAASESGCQSAFVWRISRKQRQVRWKCHEQSNL